MPLPPLMFMRKQYDQDFGLKTLSDSGPCNPPTDRVTRRVNSQSYSSSSSASSCSCSFVCCCSSSSSYSYSSKEKENVGCDNDDDDDDEDYACWACYGPRDGLRKFPPAIQVPAKLGDLTTPVPRLLERTYEAGGRLVLRKVKIHRHEFLKARRENGRLTLKLMYMDEDEMPMQGRTEREKIIKMSLRTSHSSSSLSVYGEGNGKWVEDDSRRWSTGNFTEMLSSSMPPPESAGDWIECLWDETSD